MEGPGGQKLIAMEDGGQRQKLPQQQGAKPIAMEDEVEDLGGGQRQKLPQQRGAKPIAMEDGVEELSGGQHQKLPQQRGGQAHNRGRWSGRARRGINARSYPNNQPNGQEV